MKGFDDERAFSVDIYKDCIDYSGMHEFYHLEQANDLLQSDPSLTGSDWNDYYKNNKIELEQRVYERQGNNYSSEDLANEGY